MTGAPYRLTPTTGAAATFGLIVLQVDETLEGDFRRLLPGPELALHVSRIPSGADLTPATIARMADDLPAAAGLLPQTPEYDAVAYACTSGTSLIGAARVEALVRGACRARAVCTPLHATVAAFERLGRRRIGVVSPYSAPVAEGVRRALEDAGLDVAAAVNFSEAVEANVARIDPASVAEAARGLVAGASVDGLFLSCTNLRTLDLIAPLEDALGLPVVSSNLALAWHMAAVAGCTGHLRGPGRLLND